MLFKLLIVLFFFKNIIAFNDSRINKGQIENFEQNYLLREKSEKKFENSTLIYEQAIDRRGPTKFGQGMQVAKQT